MVRISQIRPGNGNLVVVLCSKNSSPHTGYWNSVCEFPLIEGHPIEGKIMVAGRLGPATLEVQDERLVVHWNGNQTIVLTASDEEWISSQMNALVSLEKTRFLPDPADTG